jgi:hypothetical protein
MKTGKANYTSGGQQFKKKNHYDLKKGDVVARILPPIGANADKGVWSRYHAVHFGYKNMEGKFRIFESPLVKNNKTKMIEVPDAALERLTSLKAKLEEARATGNGPLMAKLNVLVGLKGVYNVDSNHHMNVILLDGSIGELKIRYKAKLALDVEIKKLQDKGVDPLSLDDGRFFVFSRNTAGKDTTFNVSVYKETVEIPGMGKLERDVVHKITPEILARLETEAFDLDNIFNKPTSEEVAQIVAESDLLSGKSPACNRIFDDRWKANRKAAETAQDDQQDDTSDVTTPLSAPPVTSTTSSATTSSATTSNGTVAAILAPATPVVTAQSAPAAKTQAAAIDEMSDEEFFKTIGVTA